MFLEQISIREIRHQPDDDSQVPGMLDDNRNIAEPRVGGEADHDLVNTLLGQNRTQIPQDPEDLPVLVIAGSPLLEHGSRFGYETHDLVAELPFAARVCARPRTRAR